MNHFVRLALWYNARRKLYRLRREEADIETPLAKLEGVKIYYRKTVISFKEQAKRRLAALLSGNQNNSLPLECLTRGLLRQILIPS